MPPLFVVKNALNSLSSVGIDAHAGVSHAQPHAIVVLPLGPDEQAPRPIVDIRHRIGGVAKQIQDDLLELDAVAGDGREIGVELRLQDDALALELGRRQRDHLPGGLVEVERIERELLLAEERRATVAMTSAARLPSRIVRRAVSLAPSISGCSPSSMRRQVLALVMMPDSGWFTSCAIDAVKALSVVARATWARSERARSNASSASDTIGHVLDGADEQRTAGDALDQVTDGVDVLHPPTRWDDAKDLVEVHPAE